MKLYRIVYKGQLAKSGLITRRGAEALAFRLAKDKGWTVADISIEVVQ